MNQENKRDAVAALHRENIVRAAAALFAQKGFDASSIDDIARESGYSRRTIYIYGKSKENLLCLAIAQELRTLRDGLRRTQEISGFFAQYDAICAELLAFHRRCPLSTSVVRKSAVSDNPLPAEQLILLILSLGTEINALLADFLAQGQREGLVRPDVFPALDAQLLTTALEAQFSLWDTRKDYLISVFSLDEKAFFARIREQLLRGLLLASKGDAR